MTLILGFSAHNEFLNAQKRLFSLGKYSSINAILPICNNCKIWDGKICTTLTAKLQANGTNTCTNCDEGTKKHVE